MIKNALAHLSRFSLTQKSFFKSPDCDHGENLLWYSDIIAFPSEISLKISASLVTWYSGPLSLHPLSNIHNAKFKSYQDKRKIYMHNYRKEGLILFSLYCCSSLQNVLSPYKCRVCWSLQCIAFPCNFLKSDIR